MKPVLAIDPGASGGLAWEDRDGITHAVAMPEGMTAQVDFLRTLAVQLPGLRAVLEKTGTARPTDAKPALAKFSRHIGSLEAALYCCAIPAEQVAPAVWQRSLGSLPREKRERKQAIKEEMARRFPALAVTLSTADALGILCWARLQDSGQRTG